VAVGLLWPMSAFSHFLTANDLYAHCTVPESAERLYCTGIIVGLADAFEHDGTMCPPDGASVSQVVDVVVQYLRDHPEKRHYAIANEAALALKQAFPCK
jgi:hypothetical protein